MVLVEALIGSLFTKAVDKGTDALFKEPEPEPKSNAGALLTGAALDLGGLLIAGMIAGSSDEKGNQSKPARQISSDTEDSLPKIGSHGKRRL